MRICLAGACRFFGQSTPEIRFLFGVAIYYSTIKTKSKPKECKKYLSTCIVCDIIVSVNAADAENCFFARAAEVSANRGG